MSERKPSRSRKALIWLAVGTPGVLAFMANAPAKEAVSNLASWIELLGLPVPSCLHTPEIDDQAINAALMLYGALAALLSAGILVRAEEDVLDSVPACA